jgi:hypothetical protein
MLLPFSRLLFMIWNYKSIIIYPSRHSAPLYNEIELGVENSASLQGRGDPQFRVRKQLLTVTGLKCDITVHGRFV